MRPASCATGERIRNDTGLLALEKIRYGDRLEMIFEIIGDCNQKMISPLLLIPLVENSFKHGASKMLDHPWVNIKIKVDGESLFFLISNGRPKVKVINNDNKHIGVKNVKKRLQLLYPSAHALNIAENLKSFEIFMKIPLDEAKGIEIEMKTETIEYAVA